MRSTPAKKRCESYDCDHFTGIDHQTGERYPHCRACAEGTVTQRLPSDDIRAAVEAAPFMEGT